MGGEGEGPSGILFHGGKRGALTLVASALTISAALQREREEECACERVKAEGFWKPQGREGPAKERGRTLDAGAPAAKTRTRRKCAHRG